MNQIDNPMYIPEADMKLLGQAGAALCDKLMWAYRLGRQQGMLEAQNDTISRLKIVDTARRAGL